MKKSTSLFVICMLLIRTASFAQPGTLDSSFGGDGKVTTLFATKGNFAYSSAIQADGKIVVVGGVYKYDTGYFALVRYMPDGKRDNTFGIKGKVLTAFAQGAGARSVAIQPDGKIVAAGNSYSHFVLARYLSNGQ